MKGVSRRMNQFARDLIVVVDPFRVGCLAPQLFNGLGYHCAAVISKSVTAPFFLSSFREGDFQVVLTETEDLMSLLRELRGFQIRAVMPGSEPGVMLADLLSDALGLQSNDVQRSKARRDKYAMAEELHRAGLAHIDHARATRVVEAVEWYRSSGYVHVVVKPLASTAADGVRFCASERELEVAAGSLLGSSDFFGNPNDSVLVQENVALDGVEYTVNTISRAGRHLVTDVWRMHRQMVGPTAICTYSDLVAPSVPEHGALAEYTYDVLDALGIRTGPAHSEVMLRPNGPVLIETGARLEGSCDPGVVTDLLGRSQLSLLPAAYLDKRAFARALSEEVGLSRCARHVYMLSERSGPVRSAPTWDKVLALPTLFSLQTTLDSATVLEKTSSLARCPGQLYLVGDTVGEVERDYQRFRELERGIYEKMVTRF